MNLIIIYHKYDVFCAFNTHNLKSSSLKWIESIILHTLTIITMFCYFRTAFTQPGSPQKGNVNFNIRMVSEWKKKWKMLGTKNVLSKEKM